jgi:hypothetical protein
MDNYLPKQKHLTIGKKYKVLNWDDDWIDINGYLIKNDDNEEIFYNKSRFIIIRKNNLNKIKQMKNIEFGKNL